jgi:hypothetical protein
MAARRSLQDRPMLPNIWVARAGRSMAWSPDRCVPDGPLARAGRAGLAGLAVSLRRGGCGHVGHLCRANSCRLDHVGDRLRLGQEHDMAAGHLGCLGADPAGGAA